MSVTNRTDPNRMRELGRAGGKASGEARRKKRDRTWDQAFLDLADAKPDEFAERLFSSGNGMVHVKALELAQSAAQARLRAHRVELDEREKRVAQAERDAEWWAAWAQASRAEYDAIQQEIAELKQQRDDLRAAISREAG